MRKILLGITGSVASILYKKLIAELQTIGEVNVILTESAKHFVEMKLLCDALEKKNGFLYMEEDEWKWKRFYNDKLHPSDAWYRTTKWEKDYPVLHIDLRDKHDVFVIAPCSVNTLAKISNGICDNLLTSVAKAWDRNRPFIIAPAANTYMMAHPTTQEHLLRFIKFSRNNSNIPTQSKMLACGTYGDGAMGEIDDIVKTTQEMLRWKFPMISEYNHPKSFDGYSMGKKIVCSGIPMKDHPGAFATQRKHSCHTGVDLYADEGTPVHAVEDGKIVCVEPFTGPKDGSPWWNDTDCVLIEGASGVVCYGEISPSMNAIVGNNIRKGDFIGTVLTVIKGKQHPEIMGWKPSMLHLELYPHGHYKPSTGFEKDKGILIDPTPYLLEAVGAPTTKLTL